MKNQIDKKNLKYDRSEFPPSMRFQQRDAMILETIYSFDGILARRQIKEMFWPTSSDQSMEKRLSKLFHNGYINWPSNEQRKYRAIPEPIIWVGWRGAIILAQRRGIQVRDPKGANENQLRLLENRLRNQGIRWMREPKWNQIQHDLKVNDIHHVVEKSVKAYPKFTLEGWVLESTFRVNTDVIYFDYKAGDGKVKRKKKGVCPDGLFVILDREKYRKSLPHKAWFLLEIDMATHDNPRFGIEKVAAGVAYIKSEKYKERFGVNAGRWLVITTSDNRMKNLMRQTRIQAGGFSHLFYFSTFDKVVTNNVLDSQIWWQVGYEGPITLPLLPGYRR
jgi:hypothetical protein